MEFNARFGDPETQPLLALLDSPLSPLLVGAATGDLASVPPPVWKPGAAVAVVMASRGYPESSSKGDVIVGTETLDKESDVRRPPRRHRPATPGGWSPPAAGCWP